MYWGTDLLTPENGPRNPLRYLGYLVLRSATAKQRDTNMEVTNEVSSNSNSKNPAKSQAWLPMTLSLVPGDRNRQILRVCWPAGLTERLASSSVTYCFKAESQRNRRIHPKPSSGFCRCMNRHAYLHTHIHATCRTHNFPKAAGIKEVLWETLVPWQTLLQPTFPVSLSFLSEVLYVHPSQPLLTQPLYFKDAKSKPNSGRLLRSPDKDQFPCQSLLTCTHFLRSSEKTKIVPVSPK